MNKSLEQGLSLRPLLRHVINVAPTLPWAINGVSNEHRDRKATVTVERDTITGKSIDKMSASGGIQHKRTHCVIATCPRSVGRMLMPQVMASERLYHWCREGKGIVATHIAPFASSTWPFSITSKIQSIHRLEMWLWVWYAAVTHLARKSGVHLAINASWFSQWPSFRFLSSSLFSKKP